MQALFQIDVAGVVADEALEFAWRAGGDETPDADSLEFARDLVRFPSRPSFQPFRTPSG